MTKIYYINVYEGHRLGMRWTSRASAVAASYTQLTEKTLYRIVVRMK